MLKWYFLVVNDAYMIFFGVKWYLNDIFGVKRYLNDIFGAKQCLNDIFWC